MLLDDEAPSRVRFQNGFLSQSEPPVVMITSFPSAVLLQLRDKFAAASPWPHVIIDGFVNPKFELSDVAFPGPDWPHWQRFGDTYQASKHTCNDIRLIPAPLRELIREACEATFLDTLERITGISRLIPDPYLDGGGLHASGPGGLLAPHTDFHLYQRLGLYRVLNLLIYLNPDWSDGDGGELGLYREGEGVPRLTIAPAFGRAVIFRTDDRSIHGFLTPVAAGKWRRSIALYYYTSREQPAFSGDTNTHWRTRQIPMREARRALHDGLILASRAFSKLAHMIDPNVREPEAPTGARKRWSIRV